MLKHLYLVLISTFILGFVVGGLVYVKNNIGKEGDGSIEVETRGYAITAYMYGGCMSTGCPSFRISDNGSYTYIRRDNSGENKRFEETLSGTQRSTLTSLVKQTSFESLYDTEFSDTCPIAYDGVAYQYDIEYEGERYEFDSCSEDLGTEKLFKLLESYFEVFRITHETI